MKKKRMEKWGWKCVQPRTIATVSTVLSFRGWWRFARHRQVAKKSVATSIYPTSRRRLPPPPPPPTPFATLVYTARSNPRLTINLVTSLLGSSRRVARTSLLGCHPGVYHSVKPEIDNNKCLVKLWRRMVNRRGRGGSQYEAGYVAFSTGIMGETRREIVKTRERTEGYEKDKNYSSFFFLSSFFFFLLRNSSSITSRILLPFSLPVISQYLTRLLIPKLRKLRELSTPSSFPLFSSSEASASVLVGSRHFVNSTARPFLYTLFAG